MKKTIALTLPRLCDESAVDYTLPYGIASIAAEIRHSSSDTHVIYSENLEELLQVYFSFRFTRVIFLLL